MSLLILAITQQSIRENAERFKARIRGGSAIGSKQPVKRTAPPILTECDHRGSELPRGQWVTIPCKTCGSDEPKPIGVKTFNCSEFGICTLANKVDGVACCNSGGKACEKFESRKQFPLVPASASWGNFPQARQWQESHERGDENPDYTHPAKWTYKTTSDLIEATKKIVPQLPHDIMAVAGVPRSGMIPASVLSAWLHIPLFEINPTTGLVQLGHGSRGKHFKVRNNGRVLVVDDTIYRGGAMAHARNRTANVPSIYAATYVRPGQQHRVDVFGEILPSPHLLEWNLLNNGVLTGNAQNKALQGGWAIDFDGVLCHDCPRDGNDTVEGDERYRQWILSAKPKFLSRMIYIPMIVTARPERFRSDTMTWLSQWGVNTKRLVMNQLPSFRERNSSDIPGWKASVLESSDTCGYIESHDLPAQAIHRLWGKPVISLESGTVYQ